MTRVRVQPNRPERAATRRGASAFTLIEVLIVIVVLGLLAAFVWPEFGPMARQERIEETGRRIKAAIAMCRASAMNEARRYRLTLRLDGQIELRRQRDAIKAPHEYVLVRESWSQLEFVLEDVWVDAVLAMPAGPPPIEVQDDSVEFTDLAEEPLPLAELEAPLDLDFEPDGTGSSARWILRDREGRGRQMTLDGRLGRVAVEPVESVDPKEVQMPKREPLEPEIEET